MSYQIPTCEPTQIEAGSVAYWDITYPEFPASEGWELRYYIRGPVDLNIEWGTDVTADGAGFEVRVPAGDTDNLTTAGAYRLIGRVTLGSEVHTVYNAPLLVLADPTAAVNAKSTNRQIRDALRTAAVSAAADAPYLSVQVLGRSVTYGRREFEAQLAHYEYLVALEENPGADIRHEAVFVRA